MLVALVWLRRFVVVEDFDPKEEKLTVLAPNAQLPDGVRYMLLTNQTYMELDH